MSSADDATRFEQAREDIEEINRVLDELFPEDWQLEPPLGRMYSEERG